MIEEKDVLPGKLFRIKNALVYRIHKEPVEEPATLLNFGSYIVNCSFMVLSVKSELDVFRNRIVLVQIITIDMDPPILGWIFVPLHVSYRNFSQWDAC